MVKTASTMLALGTPAPDFSLPDANGQIVSLADFRGAPALLVIFMCNHCPYVKHVAEPLAALTKEYQQRGVAVVGINANDWDARLQRVVPCDQSDISASDDQQSVGRSDHVTIDERLKRTGPEHSRKVAARGT